MLRIDRNSQTLSALPKPSLSESDITERYDLQEFIVNSPEAFFSEVGEELLILGKEVAPSNAVGDRIDLLGIDREGTLVIVELKRGSNKLQMLQAISYAGMVANWTADDVMERLTSLEREKLDAFLDGDVSEINKQQHILLVAEGYDYALLSATEWLHEQYGVAISCVRVEVAADATSGAEYLSCSTVYPAPELAEQAERRGRRRRLGSARELTSWDDALATTTNEAVASFFADRLANGHECQLQYRNTIVEIEGKRRFHVNLKGPHATAVQEYRFEGDRDFWRTQLSDTTSLKGLRNGRRLRFHLRSKEDFKAFTRCIEGGLSGTNWLARGQVPESDGNHSDSD